MRAPTTTILALVALLAAGCGSSGAAHAPAPATTTSATAAAATTAPAAATSAPGCRAVPRPAPKAARAPRPPASATGHGTVTLVTNCGTIRIRLDAREQPRTAASFAWLVRRRFFDGLTFHRIARLPDGTAWVIQGGDPAGDGSGGPGYTIVERPPRAARYVLGTVAMAKAGNEPPGASGSQFFIVTTGDAGLPPDYALVGHVVGSLAALRRIAAVPSSPQTEQPATPVVISRATLRSR